MSEMGNPIPNTGKPQPGDGMTALEHMMAAQDHLLKACAMYGQSHPVDVEGAKNKMQQVVDQARAVSL